MGHYLKSSPKVPQIYVISNTFVWKSILKHNVFCRLLEVSFKSLSLRKLKGRMTKVIRFLCYKGRRKARFPGGPYNIKTERKLWPFILQGPRGERSGMCERSEQIPESPSPTALQKKAARRLPQSYLTTDLVNNHIPSERILDLSSLDSSDVVVELE